MPAHKVFVTATGSVGGDVYFKWEVLDSFVCGSFLNCHKANYTQTGRLYYGTSVCACFSMLFLSLRFNSVASIQQISLAELLDAYIITLTSYSLECFCFSFFFVSCFAPIQELATIEMNSTMCWYWRAVCVLFPNGSLELEAKWHNSVYLIEQNERLNDKNRSVTHPTTKANTNSVPILFKHWQKKRARVKHGKKWHPYKVALRNGNKVWWKACVSTFFFSLVRRVSMLYLSVFFLSIFSFVLLRCFSLFSHRVDTIEMYTRQYCRRIEAEREKNVNRDESFGRWSRKPNNQLK